MQPGGHLTLEVAVTPRQGTSETTFRCQARGRTSVDLTGIVPAGEQVVVERGENESKSVKLGRGGDTTIVSSNVSVDARKLNPRRPRASIFELDTVGPNGPGGRKLAPGRYRHTVEATVCYG